MEVSQGEKFLVMSDIVEPSRYNYRLVWRTSEFRKMMTLRKIE